MYEPTACRRRTGRPDQSWEDAVDLLTARDITGAYVPGGKTPEVVVATAASDMGAMAAERVFTPLATQRGDPLKVTDVATPVDDDPPARASSSC